MAATRSRTVANKSAQGTFLSKNRRKPTTMAAMASAYTPFATSYATIGGTSFPYPYRINATKAKALARHHSRTPGMPLLRREHNANNWPIHRSAEIKKIFDTVNIFFLVETLFINEPSAFNALAQQCAKYQPR
jgi:hypothetical protein